MNLISNFLTGAILVLGTAVASGQSFWVGQTSGTEAALYSIDFYDANSGNLGFAAGENGTILKTTDGGANWAPCITGTTETIYHVEAVSASQVYACGSNGLVLSSDDNGESWSQLTIPSSLSGIQLDLHSITINPVTGVGYTCGTEQNIHKTTDFGATWTALREGYFGALYNVQTFGDDTLVFIGKNSIFASLIGRSFDGGQTFTWRDFYPVDSTNMAWETRSHDAYFFTPDSGLTVQIETMNGAGFFTSTVDWNDQFWPANQQTEEYQECIEIDNGFGLAAGGTIKNGVGSIYESNDNGVSWRFSEVPDKTPWLHDVFVGGQMVFAVGEGGTILTRDKFVGVDDPGTSTVSVSLSANPASIKTDLVLHLKTMHLVSVSLVDASGRTVKRPFDNYLANEGVTRLSIPLIGLRAGIYQVIITCGNKQISKPLVVVQ